MRLLMSAMVSAAALVTVSVAAQPPAQPAGQGGGRGGRGQTVLTSPRTSYPDRPPDDPAAVERGKALYGVNCQFCHGADTRGGDGGPSLLRSGVVLDDQKGELITPVIQQGRPDKGMPRFSFTNDQAADVAAFLHTFRAAGYDESRNRPATIVVGDAKAGEAFFSSRCASCHSPTGDLRGIASRIADPRTLQQTWLLPGSAGGRGGQGTSRAPQTRVTVSLPSGEKVEGVLDRIDDFVVALTLEDGTKRSFRLNGDTPRVDIKDPLKPHRDLLTVYKDSDIHNVTAYLASLK